MDVFLGFAQVPDNHTCKGADISPRIVVHGLNAVSVAVIVVDVDASSGIFTHWLAWKALIWAQSLPSDRHSGLHHRDLYPRLHCPQQFVPGCSYRI
ncbi:MAG: hypothetical protein EHM14_05225 [Methanothrix sp.]|nr:MAG: hypothetical protein EHM14_05225 [Methanothrix sp.]